MGDRALCAELRAWQHVVAVRREDCTAVWCDSSFTRDGILHVMPFPAAADGMRGTTAQDATAALHSCVEVSQEAQPSLLSGRSDGSIVAYKAHPPTCSAFSFRASGEVLPPSAAEDEGIHDIRWKWSSQAHPQHNPVAFLRAHSSSVFVGWSGGEIARMPMEEGPMHEFWRVVLPQRASEGNETSNDPTLLTSMEVISSEEQPGTQDRRQLHQGAKLSVCNRCI